MTPIIDLPLIDAHSRPTSLRRWVGHALLVVILPSTPDEDYLADCQDVWEEYMMRGLYVVGVVELTGDEGTPGWLTTRAESFPVVVDSAVSSEAGLVAALREKKPCGALFVLADDGQVTAGFTAGVEVDDDEVIDAIEAALPI